MLQNSDLLSFFHKKYFLFKSVYDSFFLKPEVFIVISYYFSLISFFFSFVPPPTATFIGTRRHGE